VQRTNLTLLGVPIPAGSWRFDLVYEPASVRIGLWISGVTLILLALGAGIVFWRRSSPARPPGGQPPG
jgi:uncharacterized membrane protein YfhO